MAHCDNPHSVMSFLFAFSSTLIEDAFKEFLCLSDVTNIKF